MCDWVEDGAATFEYQPAPAYLREQAEYYRQRAMRTSNPTEAEEYHCIADVFDREADAFERVASGPRRTSSRS